MGDGLPLRWLDGAGWIVLSGAPDSVGEIRSLALSRCDASGAIAYISLADDMGDALMDDMAELGAGAGYLVDLEDEDNNAIHERLAGAAMIVIESGDDLERLRRLMTGTVTHAIREALAEGALTLFEGAAASLAGAWIVAGGGKARRGVKLVENAIIVADANRFDDSIIVERLLSSGDAALGISIERGAALVLGPGGRIETWGEAQITFRLPDPTLLAGVR